MDRPRQISLFLKLLAFTLIIALFATEVAALNPFMLRWNAFTGKQDWYHTSHFTGQNITALRINLANGTLFDNKSTILYRNSTGGEFDLAKGTGGGGASLNISHDGWIINNASLEFNTTLADNTYVNADGDVMTGPLYSTELNATDYYVDGTRLNFLTEYFPTGRLIDDFIATSWDKTDWGLKNTTDASETSGAKITGESLNLSSFTSINTESTIAVWYNESFSDFRSSIIHIDKEIFDARKNGAGGFGACTKVLTQTNITALESGTSIVSAGTLLFGNCDTDFILAYMKNITYYYNGTGNNFVIKNSTVTTFISNVLPKEEKWYLVHAATSRCNGCGSPGVLAYGRHSMSDYNVRINPTSEGDPQSVDWDKLTNYPAACPAGSYLTQLDDSVTCTTIDSTLFTVSADNVTSGNFSGFYNFTGVVQFFSNLLAKAGGIFQGNLNMSGHNVTEIDTADFGEWDVFSNATSIYITNGTITLDIRSTSVPVGSVLFFDLNSCPAGWEEYTELNDRVAIGAGANYSVGDTGGEVNHTLTIAELAAHTHTQTQPAYNPAYYNIQAGADWDLSSAVPTGSTGGDKAHENRPPYYALLPCKKIAGDSVYSNSIWQEDGGVVSLANINQELSEGTKVLIDTYEGNDANNRVIELGDSYDEVHIYLEEARTALEEHLVEAYIVSDTFGVFYTIVATADNSHMSMSDANLALQGWNDATSIKLGTAGSGVYGTNVNGWTYRIIAKKYGEVHTLP